MLATLKVAMLLAAGAGAAGIVCRVCDVGAAPLPHVTSQVPDTAIVRLHISGMTCGSCPTTARLALRRVPGVYNATVTLADSLGVVQYDPRRVATATITAQLARLTGYRATVLPDSSKPR